MWDVRTWARPNTKVPASRLDCLLCFRLSVLLLRIVRVARALGWPPRLSIAIGILLVERLAACWCGIVRFAFLAGI
jgi:hypothetical protein